MSDKQTSARRRSENGFKSSGSFPEKKEADQVRHDGIELSNPGLG